MSDWVEVVLDYDGTPKVECRFCFLYRLIHLPLDSRAVLGIIMEFRREHRGCRG